MNIFVTGVAGFIGSNLSDKLLIAGHTVIGIDNFDPFYPRIHKEINVKNLKLSSSFVLYEGDIRDGILLDQIFTEWHPDVVIHLAAKAGIRPSINNITEYYDVNINGTLNLLECMRKANVLKMIFSSSSSVYGNNHKTPFLESDIADNPISPYAATKKSGELLCHIYSHLYGFDISCLRFFTVFGPGQRPDLAIHKFTRLIDDGKAIPVYGDGSTARDYTYIDDIVKGIICALDKLGGYNIYNLGESKVITLKLLIATIEKELGKPAVLDTKPLQPGDVKITYADISKARSEIGYNPSYDFALGIKLFVKWYNENKAELIYS